jgi:hypothetical protein
MHDRDKYPLSRALIDIGNTLSTTSVRVISNTSNVRSESLRLGKSQYFREKCRRCIPVPRVHDLSDRNHADQVRRRRHPLHGPGCRRRHSRRNTRVAKRLAFGLHQAEGFPGIRALAVDRTLIEPPVFMRQSAHDSQSSLSMAKRMTNVSIACDSRPPRPG